MHEMILVWVGNEHGVAFSMRLSDVGQHRADVDAAFAMEQGSVRQEGSLASGLSKHTKTRGFTKVGAREMMILKLVCENCFYSIGQKFGTFF